MGFGKPLLIFMEELRESSGTVSNRSLDPGKSGMGAAAEVAYTQAVRPDMNKRPTICAFRNGSSMHPEVTSTTYATAEKESCGPQPNAPPDLLPPGFNPECSLCGLS